MWLQGFDDAPISKTELESRSWGKNVLHMYWTEHRILNLIKKKYPEWVKFYYRIPTLIIKCDISRAFILHAFGGVYADLDILPTSNHFKVFDHLLENKVYVISQSVIGFAYANNNWMACCPYNSFWIETYLPNVKSYIENGGNLKDTFLGAILPLYHVFATSGPVALMKNQNQISLLDLDYSKQLCFHPFMKSTWISYKFILNHLLVMSFLLCFAAIGFVHTLRILSKRTRI